MHTISAFAAAAALSLLSFAPARACDGAVAACPPAVVAMPVYAPVGVRIVAVPVARPLPLPLSRFTGQPLTVVFNGPGNLPGLVDPGLTLVPLPRATRFRTRAAFPSGY